MIGLSDIGLAYLVLAANRIAPQQRSRFLQRVAREFEGHPPSPTALRLRKFQARRHNGQKCYRLTLDEVDTEEMLLACGLLAAGDRDNHRAVERALSHFLSLCYRNAFQHDEEIYASVRTELRLSALRKVSDNGPSKPKRFRK